MVAGAMGRLSSLREEVLRMRERGEGEREREKFNSKNKYLKIVLSTVTTYS